MKYEYTKDNKNLGIRYLLWAAVLFPFIAVANWYVTKDDSFLLDVFLKFFYFTPLIFLLYGLYCIYKGGRWVIIIDEKKISIKPPKADANVYLFDQIQRVEVVDVINSLSSCYLILVNDDQVKLNLNSGLKLEKFLMVAKINGLSISRKSTT